jgi:hypothetical protein
VVWRVVLSTQRSLSPEGVSHEGFCSLPDGCPGPPLIAGGCGKEVTIDPGDTSPPDVALDVYDIPTQSGAANQDNPESIDPDCCDVTRTVSPGEIPLIATGRDGEGVRGVSIWVLEGNRTCEHADGTQSIQQGQSAAVPAAENADPSVSPSTGLDSRTVTYTVTIPRRRTSCVRDSGGFEIHARATNYADQEVSTKTMTLVFSLT